MTNLTPAQQTILETAASRANGSIHLLPAHIQGGASKKVIKALKERGLIDDTDCITTLGRKAVDPDALEQPIETTANPEQEVTKVADTAPEQNATEVADTDPEQDATDVTASNTEQDATNVDDHTAPEQTTEVSAAQSKVDAALIAVEEASKNRDYKMRCFNEAVRLNNPSYQVDSLRRSLAAADKKLTRAQNALSLAKKNAANAQTTTVPATEPEATDEFPTNLESEDGEFEADVILAEQTLGETAPLSEDHLRIARKHIPEELELLTPRNWHWIRDMLTEAYILGLEDAKKKKTQTATPRRTRENSKQSQVITMLRRPEGATIEQISEMTGWNSNTVRGAMAGALKKKLGLNVVRLPHTTGTSSTYRIDD